MYNFTDRKYFFNVSISLDKYKLLQHQNRNYTFNARATKFCIASGFANFDFFFPFLPVQPYFHSQALFFSHCSVTSHQPCVFIFLFMCFLSCSQHLDEQAPVVPTARQGPPHFGDVMPMENLSVMPVVYTTNYTMWVNVYVSRHTITLCIYRQHQNKGQNHFSAYKYVEFPLLRGLYLMFALNNDLVCT